MLLLLLLHPHPHNGALVGVKEHALGVGLLVRLELVDSFELLIQMLFELELSLGSGQFSGYSQGWWGSA